VSVKPHEPESGTVWRVEETEDALSIGSRRASIASKHVTASKGDGGKERSKLWDFWR